MPAFRFIGSRAGALARDALSQLATNVPKSTGSRLMRLQGLLAPVIEALEVRRLAGFCFILFFSVAFFCRPHLAAHATSSNSKNKQVDRCGRRRRLPWLLLELDSRPLCPLYRGSGSSSDRRVRHRRRRGSFFDALCGCRPRARAACFVVASELL